MAFYVVLVSTYLLPAGEPTLRDLNYRFEHPWYGKEEDHVVNIKLERPPFGGGRIVGYAVCAGMFGRARIRGGGLERGVCRGCETSVEGVKGVQLAEPCQY